MAGNQSLDEAAEELHQLICMCEKNNIPNGHLDKIIDLIKRHEGILLKKDKDRSTSLGNALKIQNKIVIKTLLDHGAAATIFVEGYLPQSLVCTLPQTSQPPSSVFEHDPPLVGTDPEVLEMIDDAIVEYINVLKAKKLEELDASLKKNLTQLKTVLGDVATVLGIPKAPTIGKPGKQPAFNFFPKTLKVGDLVRRGPSWHYNDQDHHDIGTVEVVQGDYVNVRWRSPGAGVNRYEYDPPNSCDVQAVDPTNHMAVPAGQPKPFVPARTASLKIGDIVMMDDDNQDSTIGKCLTQPFGSAPPLGIVTSISRQRVEKNANANATNIQIDSGETMVQVLNIHSHKVSEYLSRSLMYADGSKRGVCHRACGAPNGPFELGEVVQYSDSYKCSGSNGILGSKSEKRTATISAKPVGNGATYTVKSSRSGSNTSVYDENQLQRVFSTDSSTSRASKFQIGDKVVLSSSFFQSHSEGWNLGSNPDDKKIGVVVFAAPPDDSSTEQRSIMVVSENPNDVYKGQPFAFKESWLEIYIPGFNCPHDRFKIGDRVQLNSSLWKHKSPETGGKVLGTPEDGVYGIVVAPGTVRDGIQRLIEVVAMNGKDRKTDKDEEMKNHEGGREDDEVMDGENARTDEGKDKKVEKGVEDVNEDVPQISLYPGYALAPANWMYRSISSEELKSANLLDACNDLIARSNLDVDVSFLIDRFGNNIWSSLFSIARTNNVSIEDFFICWESWYTKRPMTTFDSAKEIEIMEKLKKHEHLELSNDLKAWKYRFQLTNAEEGKARGETIEDTDESGNSFSSPDPQSCDIKEWIMRYEKETKWACENCKFTNNDIGDSKCRTCRKRTAGWTCGGCNHVNKVGSTTCGVCASSFYRSKCLRAVLDFNAKIRKKKAQLNDVIEQHFILEQEETKQSEKTSIGSTSMLHVGSYDGCGGNPDGFANCKGAGNCTTEGPDKCRSCGRGSHWTCCGNPIKDSSCDNLTSAWQLHQNAQLLEKESMYDQPRRCKDIEGVLFGVNGVITDWICSGCSSPNDLQKNKEKCKVCDTSKSVSDKKKESAVKTQTFSFDTPGALSGLGSGASRIGHKASDGPNTSNDSESSGAFLPPFYYRLRRNAVEGFQRLQSEVGPAKVITQNDAPTTSPVINTSSLGTFGNVLPKITKCAAGHVMVGSQRDYRQCDVCCNNIGFSCLHAECSSCDYDKCMDCVNKEVESLIVWDGDSDEDDDEFFVTLRSNSAVPGTDVQDSVSAKIQKPIIDTHFEENKNRLKLEELEYGVVGSADDKTDSISHTTMESISMSCEPLGPPLQDDSLEDTNKGDAIGRQTSAYFSDLSTYQSITDLDHLVLHKDKAANTAMHHAAFVKLPKTLNELQEYAKQPPLNKSRWEKNAAKVVPQALVDGIATIHPASVYDNSCVTEESEATWSTSNHLNLPVPVRGPDTKLPLYAFDTEGALLYSAVKKRALGQKKMSVKVMKSIFRTPKDYKWSDNLDGLVDAMLDINKDEIQALSEHAVDLKIPHAHAYKAVSLIDCGYGFRAAQEELDKYLQQIEDDEITVFDPIAFFAIYSIWKDQNQPYKAMRLCASDTLQCLRCFTEYEIFLTPGDDVDKKVKAEGIDNDDDMDDDDDDDDDAVIVELKPEDPEFKWKKAKEEKGMKSPSMDKLMALTGMREIKNVAIKVCLEALIAKKRPKGTNPETSMNFLFTGNPGTGKTTVANLLAGVMVELGFRKNPTPVMTSANDILSGQDPAADFQQMIDDAGNGTIFIDEAYHFNPAPKGSTSNASNKVLDLLMKVSETKRETLSFILAGYKKEILELMQYNPGFPSRFPLNLDFPDYTESQIQKIMVDYCKEKGYKFQSSKECGVPIAKIVARRIAKASGTLGFGNAREVRNRVDLMKKEQSERLGTLELYNKHISAKDYTILKREDTIGMRPDFDNSPILKELDMMIGLGGVKAAVRDLMNLQIQNYDNELRGEKVQYISLHRVFMGNAGTGKTTVARLYGRLLKEFGFLSDGDLIEVKPSDLKGSSVGEASQQTRKIIEMAKGKVLFIDEAYGLDPTRRGTNSYGGDALDTIVEQIEGSAGSDMAVVMAGYQKEMEDMFRNAGNQGLARRFNLEAAFHFEDMSDEDLKKILLYSVRKEALKISPDTVDQAIRNIAQRRRLDGFGNAAAVYTALDRAKVRLSHRKAKAAANAERCRVAVRDLENAQASPTTKSRIGGGALKSIDSFSNDDPLPSPEECICDPYLLIIEDFIVEETSAEKAKDAINDLENVEHVMDFIIDIEDTLVEAKAQDRSIAEILDTCHMIFTGPPGTGKTTVAQRMGTMFKQLELLPRSDVEVVNATSLMGRFVGDTENNVMDAMKRAKGGILFIDEAYGFVGGRGTFGTQALDALMQNITAPDFKGNLVVILAGYADKMEGLFQFNPGFRSRFDKKRLEFPPWTADMATSAIIKKADKDGYSVTEEGKEILPILFRQLEALPDWGSARDVYETIYNSMYSKRSSRLGSLARMKRVEAEAERAEGKAPVPVASLSKSRRELAAEKQKQRVASPYEVADIRAAFEDPIKRRSNNSVDISSTLSESNEQNASAQSKLISVSSEVQLKSYIEAKSSTLNVVCYSVQPGDSPVHLSALSAEFTSVNFMVVDANRLPDVFEEHCGGHITSLLLYMNGRNCYRLADVHDKKELRMKINYFSKLQPSLAKEPKPPSEYSNDDDDLFNMNDDKEKEEVKKVVKHEVKTRVFGEDEDEDGGDSTDWTILLEEACGELGYTFEQMKEFLEKGVYPEELVLLIMSKVGTNEKSEVVEGMNTQRVALLAKVTKAIEQKAKAKTEEEARIQAKVQRIGRCPVGFAWDPVPGGWRCQGGSHFVDAASVNKISD